MKYVVTLYLNLPCYTNSLWNQEKKAIVHVFDESVGGRGVDKLYSQLSKNASTLKIETPSHPQLSHLFYVHVWLLRPRKQRAGS